MTKPLVSVIVPIYNHERFVRQALQSVLQQTYRPIELIAIDDGSQDTSADIAAATLRQSPGNSVFIRRANRGAHNTLNQGLALATGDYLAILNSDDLYHPCRIQRCVDTAQRTGRDFIFTGVDFIDDYGATAQPDEYLNNIKQADIASSRYPTIGYALLKNQLAITTGNFFFRRNLAEKVVGFRHYRYVHDWDFILRSVFYTEPYYLRDRLYSYRIHDRNTFKSLSEIEGYETGEVMRNLLRLMITRLPENHLAPSPHYWPEFFEWFVQTWNYQVYLP